MSKYMVVWRKKEVVELTKNSVKHVMAASNKYSKNNKIRNNDLSKTLPPTKEINIFFGLMGKCRDAQTEEFKAPGSKKFCLRLSTCAGGIGSTLPRPTRFVVYDSN